MKTVLSTKEWQDFLEYHKLLSESPCVKCRQNTTSCTGCDRQKSWRERLESIDISDELLQNKDLCRMAELKMDVDACTKEIKRLQDQSMKYIREFNKLSENVLIGSDH